MDKTVFKYNKTNLKNASHSEIIKKFNIIWDKKIKLVMMLTKKNDKKAVFSLLENKRYEEYINLLVNIGIVTSFSDKLLDEMENVLVGDISLKQHFKEYTTRGRCKAMSVALSTLFGNNAVLKNGTIHVPLIEFFHQWLEYDGKVYDTTLHLIFPVDYYYAIYSPVDVHQLTDEEIEKIKNNILNRIKLCSGDKKEKNVKSKY